METSRHGGFDASRFEQLAAIEERHFWFRTRRSLIARSTPLITAGLASGFYVLEFGCGTGNLLGVLEAASPRGVVVGMDLFHEGLLVAKRSGAQRLVQADAARAPFRQAFDVIGAFDVIEHLPNDTDALRQMLGLLKPGGHLLITVPAHPWLWSDFDELAHHCRRYTELELRSKLDQIGFEVVRLSPFMATILPLVWLHRKFLRRSKTGVKASQDLVKAELGIVPVVNAILTALLWLESQFVALGGRLPFGTSFFVFARKRG